jgi:hypothetical protein
LSSNTLLYLEVLQAKEHAPTLFPSVVFTFGLKMSPSKSFIVDEQMGLEVMAEQMIRRMKLISSIHRTLLEIVE